MSRLVIAGVEIENPFCLAPLAGYTDYAMRKISSDYGAGLLYTEMESCEALFYRSKATIQDLLDTKLDKKNCQNSKLALQIFGGKEDVILHTIPMIEELASYDFLDFNCGCPVPKVIRQQAGSYWLKRQNELIHLVKEMVKISNKPVILKMRIGYSDYKDIVPLCLKLQDAGVQAIALHGRTRNEFFSGEVHYDIIREVKDHLSIPVIANGEISQENYLSVKEKTHADGFMIGQHAMGYPKIFEDLNRIEEGKEPRETTLFSQLEDLRKHIDLLYQIKDERKASSNLRSIAVHYIKAFKDSKKYRALLVKATSKEEYERIISDMQNHL